MKKLLQSLFIMMCFAISAFAQERTINGTVTNKGDGAPIPGVSVKISGTNRGTITNSTGKFELVVSTNSVLHISSIGFAAKTIKVGSATTFNIVLEDDAQMLEETVVIAYGTTTKKAFVGSAAKIGAQDLVNRPVTNAVSSLAGAAPGIQLTSGSGQPGDAPTVRIRGFGSYSGSNDPLYIVDGIQYDGSLSSINVNDIESISVLKDAASTSIYGSSGANGVILITTKKGRSGNETMEIRVMQGITSRGLSEYETVDAYQYYPLAWQAYRNSLIYPTAGTGATLAAASATAKNGIKALLGNNPFNVANQEIVGTDGKLNPNASLLYDDFDWIDPLKRVGTRGDYSLATSGATEKSDYYMSVGYLNEKGFLERSDFNRINGRLSVNSRPTTWFKTGLNISGNLTRSNQADAGGSTSFVNPFYFTRNIGPIYPVYAHDPATGDFLLDINGEKIYDTGNLEGTLGVPNRPSGAMIGRHTVQETLLNSNQIKRNVLGGRTYGEIKFLKDFKFTTNLGVDMSNYLSADYQNNIVGDGAPNGRARNTSSTTTSYTFEQLLNYNKKFGDHNLDVLLGHNNYSYRYKYLTGARNTQVVENNAELINFTTTTDLESYTNTYTKEAVFGRLTYDYQSKYFFTGTLRRDGTSKFLNKWGTYGSIGAGWILSEEDFIKNVPWISYLKLRSSYGTLGNDGILDSDGDPIYYAYQGLYSLGYNNGAEPGVLIRSFFAPDVTWETNTQADIAVEFGFLKNRLRGSFEVFDKRSKDLLFAVPLPLSTGLGIGGATGTISKNIGTMWNKGIEIQLGGDIVKTKDFTWDLNVNWTLVRNKMTKMPDENPTIINGTKQIAVGHSIYDFWLRQWAGVNPADGAGLYEINPENPGSAADTRTIDGKSYTININNALYAYSGSAIPDFMGSIANTFKYKNLSLSLLFNYQVGGKSFDANYQSLMSYSAYGGGLHVDALNSWKAVGDNSSIPRLDINRSTFNNATSSRFLIDASYISLKTATLSYNLPKTMVSKLGMSRLNVFGSGENLFIASKRKGLDPSQAYTGVNSNVYSPTRVISLGLNATF